MHQLIIIKVINHVTANFTHMIKAIASALLGKDVMCEFSFYLYHQFQVGCLLYKLSLAGLTNQNP